MAAQARHLVDERVGRQLRDRLACMGRSTQVRELVVAEDVADLAVQRIGQGLSYAFVRLVGVSLRVLDPVDRRHRDVREDCQIGDGESVRLPNDLQHVLQENSLLWVVGVLTSGKRPILHYSISFIKSQ